VHGPGRDLRHVGVLEIWKLNDCSSAGWSLEHRIDLLQHVGRDDLIELRLLELLVLLAVVGPRRG
jgi:hypothetical protein